MPTYVVPAGPNQLTLTNTTTDVFDAVTNNAIFLHDFLGFRASGTTNRFDLRAYPLKIDGAAQDFIWNGGRFYGNIPENLDWMDWYGQTGFTAFNGPLFFVRNSALRFTLNDAVFGIRNDLSSGGADGVRLNVSGNATINRPRVWCQRDDWIECDDINSRTHTINDGFFENLFVWISATGVVPNTFFFANRCLVHFRRWPYDGQLIHGPILKVSNATDSPKFRFNDVCLVMDYRGAIGDNGRFKSALQQTQATNGSRLLILNGNHTDREVVSRAIAAGFTVLEDGAGTAATDEWLARKAAFLNEGPTIPPVQEPSLVSPATMSVTVGS